MLPNEMVKDSGPLKPAAASNILIGVKNRLRLNRLGSEPVIGSYKLLTRNESINETKNLNSNIVDEPKQHFENRMS